MGFKFKKLRPKLVEKDEAAILPLKSEKKRNLIENALYRHR